MKEFCFAVVDGFIKTIRSYGRSVQKGESIMTIRKAENVITG
ncbi:hypothetical protein [Halalkalibacter wakoensis]|nr:hypothetical protein [Halalkalibacter wakoensis]